MESSMLLHRYRNDRRRLLEFLLSSHPIKPANSPCSSTVLDFDSLSVDYIINCINSGEALDIAEGSKKCLEESRYPVSIVSPPGSCYFLCCDPDLSGPPPCHAPPRVDAGMTSSPVLDSSDQLDRLVVEDFSSSGDDDVGYGYSNEVDGPRELAEDANVLSFGLPILCTGLSDDDLRETAYELLLCCMIFSGLQLYTFEDKRKGNKSRFLSRLKSKKEKSNSQSHLSESHLELLNIIRSQMQISEGMDSSTRQQLMQLSSVTSCKQINISEISLELLNSIGKSDFPSEKLYHKWKKRQANILEELIYHSPSNMIDEHVRIRSFIEMLGNNEQWDTRISTSEQAKILLAIKKLLLKLSSMPGKFDIPGETYYWTTAYHLNINIYEKLLSSVFDILDEGQLLKEVDEVLATIRMCWATLGINQKMHDALYGWLLFRKFVETGETELLDNAILTIQRVQSRDDDEKQEAYINSLICSREISGRTLSLNLLDAIFLSISIWCGKKLNNYHQHFNQRSSIFERVLSLFMLVGMPSVEESGDIKLIKSNAGAEATSRHLKACIENSIRATCRRLSHVMGTTKIRSNSGEYPMAKLADELILVVEKDSTVFSPVLCRWCPEAGMMSSMQLHKFYGKKLKPFLAGVTCLSDEVRSVLPTAYLLDQKLTHIYYSACGKDKLRPFNKDLDHYQIGEVCKPVVLDWLNGQHVHILEWTERAFNLEDWEPLSFRQRHAASIIEVFRILEETADQLFSLKLPLNTTHLQSLLSIIFRSLDTYLLKLAAQLVEKSHLFPAAPALTRFKETVIPTINKKSISSTVLEENILSKLKFLSASKLCVRVNTLQYIQNKLGALEDSIRESWTLARTCANEIWANETNSVDGSSKCCESTDGLFAAFNKIKKDADDAINTIFELIGTRVVFWDLRNPFLFSLYRGKVESARFESSLANFDLVLDQICTIISDTLRDSVVLSICRASMDGYVWVLLEGGPSRAFLDTDVQLMQEDLQLLKDFFIADGEGLPHAVVDQEGIIAQKVIDLYSFQSETLIEMLMEASEQVSVASDYRNSGGSPVEDAHTLLRVLCHKKDGVASKFLKMQYQLPKSSEYEDTSTMNSPLISNLLKSQSSQWAKKSQRSFRSMTKKLQAASSEIRYGGI